MFKVMVSPVSTQVFPVVVTALTLKPEKVVLLATPRVNVFAGLIERALKFSGIGVEKRYIDPYSFDSISSAVSDIENPFCLLNCGTKFTAISLFRRFGVKSTYYYLPDGRVVDFDGNEVLKVSDKLVDVDLHSQMYGFEIVEEREDIERIRFREELTRYVARKPILLTFLVRLFQQGFVRSLPGDFARLAEKKGVLAYRGGKFIALDKEYLGGKWLEELVFLELLDKGFYDVRIGVKVRWYGEEVTNEIDVMATRNNRLYLFSCKTGKHLRDIVKHLYELEELTERIGGDFGRSFLVMPESLYRPSPPDEKELRNTYGPGYFRFYKEELSKHRSFRNLSKRARLLGIEILTPRILEEKKWL
ncbi:MAG: DUF1887 family CARF protein [Desulfurobacteriaceae bacterium]